MRLVPEDACLLGCVFYIADYQKYLDAPTIDTWKQVCTLHTLLPARPFCIVNMLRIGCIYHFTFCIVSSPFSFHLCVNLNFFFFQFPIKLQIFQLALCSMKPRTVCDLQVISQYGGQVDESYSNRITHVLCEHQKSDVFQLVCLCDSKFKIFIQFYSKMKRLCED